MWKIREATSVMTININGWSALIKKQVLRLGWI